MNPTKLRLIMLILTPPIWFGCQLLLAGTYLVTGVLIAYERWKARSVFDRIMVIAVLLCIVLTFANLDSDYQRPHETCRPGLTEWQCNVYSLQGRLMVLGYIFSAWIAVSMGIIWQMIRIIYRYWRWVRHARSTAKGLQRTAPQTDPIPASR